MVPAASNFNVATTFAEIQALGEVLAKSGYFVDVRSAGQAVVKVLAGRELGFGPIASMKGVHIIEGSPSVGAHLMASIIKRSGKYDYKILRCDKEACELEFSEKKGQKWEPLGKVGYTIKDAVDSGTALGKEGKVKANWKRSPDDMLFARAISKGYRRYCPDLTGGVLLYDPDELDAVVADAVVTNAVPPTPNPVKPAVQTTVPAPVPAIAPPTLAATPPAPIATKPLEQPASQPEAAGITKDQFLAISTLLSARSFPADRLAKFLGIQSFREMPASLFDLVRLIVDQREDTDKLLRDLKIGSIKEVAPDVLGRLLRVRVTQSVDSLCGVLNIDGKQLEERCQQLFGIRDTTALSNDQLLAIERRLADYRAKQQSSAKAG